VPKSRPDTSAESKKSPLTATAPMESPALMTVVRIEAAVTEPTDEPNRIRDRSIEPAAKLAASRSTLMSPRAAQVTLTAQRQGGDGGLADGQRVGGAELAVDGQRGDRAEFEEAADEGGDGERGDVAADEDVAGALDASEREGGHAAVDGDVAVAGEGGGDGQAAQGGVVVGDDVEVGERT
jgi:hypothetical protein